MKGFTMKDTARDKTKVHIRDQEGRLVYNRLYDDGSLVLRFESGHGFVDRLLVKRKRYDVMPGWPGND